MSAFLSLFFNEIAYCEKALSFEDVEIFSTGVMKLA